MERLSFHDEKMMDLVRETVFEAYSCDPFIQANAAGATNAKSLPSRREGRDFGSVPSTNADKS
jgi:hypothetical protein